tara:strand:+ start:1385 stop:1978 length:594 start_codon:yes stop_codon:yes gene_type:complete
VPAIAIVGLGNPGTRFVGTRHNVGFWFLDEVVRSLSASWRDRVRYHASVAEVSAWGKKLILIKPTTYMNSSGSFLHALLKYHNCAVSEMILAHDDVAFPVGQLKISQNRGDGGHNGVADVIRAIGSNFIRFRLGVGPKKDIRMDLTDHVLGRLTSEETKALEQNLNFLLDSLGELVDKGCALAMNSINHLLKAQNNP